MSVSDDGRQEAEQPPADEVTAQPAVTFVDGQPVVSYTPVLDDTPTPPLGFPAPIMPKPRRSYRKMWLSLLAAAVTVALVAVGYTVVRVLVDNSTYDAAHAAYEKADCASAIGQYDDVITAWRIIKLGSTVAHAESEKAECVVFNEGPKRQQAGNLPGALTSYATFIPGRQPSPLLDAARTRITELFKQPEPSKLATIESCDTLQTLRDQKLLDPASAPAFLAGCGAAYVRGTQRAKAITIYVQLFSDYSTDKVAATTEAEMIKDRTWCDYIKELRAEPVLAALKDLVPGVLLTCAKDPNATPAVVTKYAQEFLKDFSTHRFAPEMLATYAAALNKSVRADADATDLGGAESGGSVGGTKAVLLLFNDSAEPLRIAFSGPEPRVEEIEACAACPTRTKNSPSPGCNKQAPSKRILLTPGEYDIALDSSGKKTIGAYAHWTLQPGKLYGGCYFVESPT